MQYAKIALNFAELHQGPPVGTLHKRRNAYTSIRGTIKNSFHTSLEFSERFCDLSVLLFNDYEKTKRKLTANSGKRMWSCTCTLHIHFHSGHEYNETGWACSAYG